MKIQSIKPMRLILGGYRMIVVLRRKFVFDHHYPHPHSHADDDEHKYYPCFDGHHHVES
jgi:hypothetical protein